MDQKTVCAKTTFYWNLGHSTGSWEGYRPVMCFFCAPVGLASKHDSPTSGTTADVAITQHADSVQKVLESPDQDRRACAHIIHMPPIEIRRKPFEPVGSVPGLSMHCGADRGLPAPTRWWNELAFKRESDLCTIMFGRLVYVMFHRFQRVVRFHGIAWQHTRKICCYSKKI